MSTIKNTRNIYSQIAKPVEPVAEVSAINSSLMDKTLEHLQKKPQIAPNITRKTHND